MSNYLKSFVTERALSVANSVPGAKVQGLVVEEGDGVSEGTAAVNRRTKKLYVSSNLVKKIDEYWDDQMDQRKAMSAVLIHEGVHSGHTHYWPKTDSISAHWLFNHLEDIRMNSIAAEKVHYFKDGIKNAYEAVGARVDEEGKVELDDPSASTSKILLNYIQGCGKHATSPDAYTIWLSEAHRIVNPEAKEYALYLAGEFEKIRTIIPDDLHSLSSSRSASAEWALLAEGVKNKLDPVFGFKEEEKKIQQIKEKIKKDYEEITKKIKEALKRKGDAKKGEDKKRENPEGKGEPETGKDGEGSGKGNPEGKGEPETGKDGEGSGKGNPEGKGEPETGKDGEGSGKGNPEGKDEPEAGKDGEGSGRGNPEGKGEPEAGKDGGESGRGNPEGKDEPETGDGGGGFGRGNPEGRGEKDRPNGDFEKMIEDYIDSLSEEERKLLEKIVNEEGGKKTKPVEGAEEKTTEEMRQAAEENKEKAEKEKASKRDEEIHRKVSKKDGGNRESKTEAPGGAGHGDLPTGKKPLRVQPNTYGDQYSQNAILRGKSLVTLMAEARKALSRSLADEAKNYLKTRPEKDEVSGDLEAVEACIRLDNPKSGNPIFVEHIPQSEAPPPRRPMYSRILIAVDGSGSMDRFSERTKDTLHILHRVLGREHIPVISAIDHDDRVAVINGGGWMEKDIRNALNRIEELVFNSGYSDMAPAALGHLYNVHRAKPMTGCQNAEARIIVLSDCIAGYNQVEAVRESIRLSGLPGAVLSVGPEENNKAAEKILNKGVWRTIKPRIIGIDGRTYTEALFELFAWMQNPESTVTLDKGSVNKEVHRLIEKDKKQQR